MAAEDDRGKTRRERPGKGAADAALDHTQTADAPLEGAVDPGRLPPIDPARYHVVREFARGGLGRILEVRDLRIGRVVALKEILRDSNAAYARFVREALITARLEHPSIVPVHDVGRWPSGSPFYSMKLISGRSLDEVILATRTLEARLALLPNVIAVADAIAYAHSQGIIHRDLKPANVLVGAFGETVVIDWGLAKDLRAATTSDEIVPELESAPARPTTLSSEGGLTVAGAVLGTPYYMPPEQATGVPVDERADVYALGALLYEVLTGAAPYQSAPSPLAAVVAGPPTPAEELAPAIPPDLAAITRKAMARQPQDRYPSARELAEDLRRFQTGRLVSAHVYSRGTLLKRWLRRYRAPVIVAAAALTILAAVGAVSVSRVVAERDVARRRANELLLTQAGGALERDATEALRWLRTYPLDGEGWERVRTLAIEADGRGVARHVPPRNGFFTFTTDGLAWVGAPDGEHLELHDAASGALLQQLPHRGRVERLLAVPDGRTLAVLDEADTAVTLVDLPTGTARRLPGHPGPITRIAVSPDGRQVASGSSDGLVRVAPLGAGAGPGRELRGHAGEVYWMAFSADSRWLLSMANESAAATIWEVETGAARTLTGPRDVVVGAVAPDGALVALSHQDGAVDLWSPVTGEQVRSLSRHGSRANWVMFSPDGRWIASAGDDGLVRVTEIATGASRTLSGHTSAVTGLAFSHDSSLIASGGGDGEVRLWAVAGDEERVLGRHPGRVFYLAFARDGRHLATTTLQSSWSDVRIWDVATLERRGLRCHRGPVYEVAISPDGRRMATGSDDNGICLWDPRTGASQRLEGHTGLVYSIAFAPDGARLASASFDGSVRLWELGACAAAAAPGAAGCAPTARVLAGHRGAVRRVVFSPDGRRLASASADKTVRLWDAASGESQILTGHQHLVRKVEFSPDGLRLASTGEDHDVWLWDARTGAGVPLRGHTDRVNLVVFSADGRALWTSSFDRTVRRWDVATGESRVAVQQIGKPGSALALSPDGRWIAVNGTEGRVLLVDAATLEERVLGHHPGAVSRLRFSPDGARLMSAGSDQTVRLWEVSSGSLEAVFHHDSEVVATAYAPDGRWIVSAGNDPVVRLWPAPPRGAVPVEPPALTAWMAALSTATLDERDQVR